MDAHVGLVAAMCCVGACYSSIPAHQTRQLMDLVSSAIDNSPLMASVFQNAFLNVKFDWSSFGSNQAYLEELQAIMLVQILLTWNGTPTHREMALRNWPRVVSIARNAKLLNLLEDDPLRSPVHQADLNSLNAPVARPFDWSSWIEQEKRIRTMYLMFVYDASVGLYFNRVPELNPWDIHLPLPADDAAWDATSGLQCAEALGLCALSSATVRNPDCTHGAGRPGFNSALDALLKNNYHVRHGATNVYGKFILLHALADILRQFQHHENPDFLNPCQGPAYGWSIGATGAPTPNHSTRATPVGTDGNSISEFSEQTLLNALDKFKMVWDWDAQAQFPANRGVNCSQHGFLRDGLYLYWLVRHLVKNTRVNDLCLSSDQRFVHVRNLQRWIQRWVLTDGASRGEELGCVGDYSEGYDIQGMTLDMSKIFQPI